MRIACLLSFTFAVTAALPAQITIRGQVEDVQNTFNQFYLDGTNIPVTSTALNLNLWQGQHALLDVVNIGTAAAPILRVDAATPTTKVMDMGNLRLGETKTWEVFAPTGSAAFIFMDWTANTGFTPLPGFGGAWLLGSSPFLLDGGIATFGVFQTTFTTPNNPGLVGLRVTSQALVGGNAGWAFSNVDDKTVEN
ncbi:MAG: hypothetical protein KAI24_10815 [Planctomycetes bacterium]|nr:hypothetical protein [Planctomycetota bacterium]